jgi:cobalt-zinc-cadmium efflux system outer membrane protein
VLFTAIEAAWERQPQARVAEQRRAEFAARERAAQSMFRDAPAVSLENWSDRWTMREGFAKYAGEFAMPLWLPGERAQTKEALASERRYFEAVVLATKLRTAGEVREAYWAVRLAQVDVELAALRDREARALADDLERRLKAGVIARTDAQTGRIQVQLAQSALAQAQSLLFRALRGFEQLTGFSQLPELASAAALETLDPSAQSAALHPGLQALESAVDAARANLKLQGIANRDVPELGVGAFRERSRSISPFENIVTLRVRIPLSTEQRNAPRIAAASVVLGDAQANLQFEQTRLAAERSSTQRELASAREVLALAQSRRVLALDNQRLIARAFDLGEADLPTRLRAQNEFLDAELALRRAELEQQRAISRVNQAFGLLP